MLQLRRPIGTDLAHLADHDTARTIDLLQQELRLLLDRLGLAAAK